LVRLPLPEDPVVAAWAVALNEAGEWAYVLDAGWRYVFVTDDLRTGFGEIGVRTPVPIGSHYFSAEGTTFRARLGGVYVAAAQRRARFLRLGPFVLASTTGGRAQLGRVVAFELADLVEALQPQQLPVVWTEHDRDFTLAGVGVAGSAMWIRIDDDHGEMAGVCEVLKLAAGMSHLAAAAATADLAHLDRMRVVEHADRRPAAILMADLEASSPLSRRLSSAQYFAFGRRLVRAADDCIIDAGGIVGRHAGDGVVAFFLAETAGSESAAARGCISAARTLRDALPDIAGRSDIAASELSLRFGLHWGATLYVGRILTRGRSEVTALGDEVNEAARIEACATGGRLLSSKGLLERLDPDDAAALGIEADHLTYTLLADLDTATDKARRDAPAIPVHDIAVNTI
jgi:class 3 adenylate cyclase